MQAKILSSIAGEATGWVSWAGGCWMERYFQEGCVGGGRGKARQDSRQTSNQGSSRRKRAKLRVREGSSSSGSSSSSRPNSGKTTVAAAGKRVSGWNLEPRDRLGPKTCEWGRRILRGGEGGRIQSQAVRRRAREAKLAQVKNIMSESKAMLGREGRRQAQRPVAVPAHSLSQEDEDEDEDANDVELVQEDLDSQVHCTLPIGPGRLSFGRGLAAWMRVYGNGARVQKEGEEEGKKQGRRSQGRAGRAGQGSTVPTAVCTVHDAGYWDTRDWALGLLWT